jgi:hypothetical protein
MASCVEGVTIPTEGEFFLIFAYSFFGEDFCDVLKMKRVEKKRNIL